MLDNQMIKTVIDCLTNDGRRNKEGQNYPRHLTSRIESQNIAIFYFYNQLFDIYCHVFNLLMSCVVGK